MFQLLGLHPGPDTTAAAAASLAGLDPGHARRLLRELTHAHLLTEHSPGRYTFHDLLRAYAAEQAATSQDTDAARGHRPDARPLPAHRAHRRAAAAAARGEPTSWSRRARGHARAARELSGGAGLVRSRAPRPAAALALAAEAGFDVHAWQLPWAMASFLDWRGHWHEWAAVERAAWPPRPPRRQGRAGHGPPCAAAACLKRSALTMEARVHQAECLRSLPAARRSRRRGPDPPGSFRRGRAAGPLRRRARPRRAGTRPVPGHRQPRRARLTPSTRRLVPRSARRLPAGAHVLPAGPGLYRELGNRVRRGRIWDSLGYADTAARPPGRRRRLLPARPRPLPGTRRPRSRGRHPHAPRRHPPGRR